MNARREKYLLGTLVRVVRVQYNTEQFQRFMNQFVGLVGFVSGTLPDGEIEVTFKDDYGNLQMCFDDYEIETIDDRYHRFLYAIYGTQMGRFECLFR